MNSPALAGRLPGRLRLGPVLLALLAYVPAVASAPGRMPSDTKLFLYLDPGRLISDAPWTWDSRQFAGWVPHQTISYLWPSGPWFWLFDTLGVPDWIAHRLWIGTLLFAGGLGARWAARHIGLTGAGALVAAMVYQLSPYVLPYVSRTSVMLLPWAGLGWLIGLTIRAATSNRWRHAAAFALVVATVGAVNATATAMIAPAPLLWLAHAAAQRTISWRRAAVTAARLGALSLAVSLWWIAMLVVQGRHGADVLAYSETLEAVSLTSNSIEVSRGLGYWLFYVRDPIAFATTASERYMLSRFAIAVSFALLLAGVAGLALVRWANTRFAALLVGVGVLLAVGVHPIGEPSPIMAPIAEQSRSSIALAMRSSTRALPLSVMGLALVTGALVTSLRARAARRVAPWAVGALAIANLPVLFTGGLVDPALERDEDPPLAWQQAADALDASAEGYRVLQVPGAEFGAFRWGYTVDPPLPGLTTKPLVTRDLLPLGSPAVMDLLNALDDRFQAGTVEPDAIAPIARLLGVDTIWVPGDIAFERFRLPRPGRTAALFAAIPTGLGEPEAFGVPLVNEPAVPIVDEVSLGDPTAGTAVAQVSLVPVVDPEPVVRAKSATVIVEGSGDGIVDAAAAGVIDGHQALLPAATLEPDELATAVGQAQLVVVTDSNRDRAHHWRSSQDVWGFTESGGPEPEVLSFDSADQRLPVFDSDSGQDQTVAEQRGPVTAVASAYGEPFAYRPEDRAAMAIDGDPVTAWTVADRADPLGQFIQLTTSEPAGRLTVVQPLDPATNRWITEVSITVDAVERGRYGLDESSRSAGGQDLAVTIPAGGTVRITIAAVGELARPSSPGPDGVGFAEVRVGDAGPTDELVLVPAAALAAAGNLTPAVVVLTRLRTDPANRWRDDPENVLVRIVPVATERSFSLDVQVRLDRRAADEVVAEALGLGSIAAASERLTGVPTAGGWAAVDGDQTTAWQTVIGAAPGAQLEIPLDPTEPITSLTIRQRIDEEHSTATVLALTAGGVRREVAVPPPDADGTSTVTFAPLQGDVLTVELAALDTRPIADRRTAEQVSLPVAIVELSGPGITSAPLPSSFATGCRSDLLTVDGLPVPIDVSGDVEAAMAGAELDVRLCDAGALVLGQGEHVVRSTAGATTGFHVDRVVLTSGQPEPAAPDPDVVIASTTRTSRAVTVGACPQGCWLVFGEGYNTGWRASGPDGSLGRQQMIDGGFNGWWLPPSGEERTITIRWTAQRVVWICLAISISTVVVCAGLVIADRRRWVRAAAAAPVLDPWPGPVGTNRALLAGALLVVAATLCIAPVWGIVAFVVAALTCGWARRPALLGWVALAGAALVAGRVIGRVHRYHYVPSPDWPGNFSDLHRPMLFVLAAAVVAAATGAGARPARGP